MPALRTQAQQDRETLDDQRLRLIRTVVLGETQRVRLQWGRRESAVHQQQLQQQQQEQHQQQHYHQQQLSVAISEAAPASASSSRLPSPHSPGNRRSPRQCIPSKRKLEQDLGQ
ncbi:hypothetical protein DUNSADRAFT_11174 [Dunaliella salina]|uniref:Encoded protein n=1 Tax=Dunaliella salina TaxID=3046 RepID=A0ABQ7GDZ8_DUNSA|nr:hypothetical protein DUNSADRAFT_11174 [Dunaliella salina]|eukprot:KAF5832835.1 hypothetical protein DUNSADRAFT_11174 [Dunaliella salina]